MERKHVNIKCFILFLLLLLVTKVCLQDNKGKRNLCAYLHCNENEICVHRKFRCKEPPCPGMLFCAKSRTESLKGPSVCDTVLCTSGYMCLLKVRRCRWDEAKCEQQIARCVSRKEYFEGPASCAGYQCPQGTHCILRESLCVNPPCKLLRSCAKNKEVHLWFGKCRNLGCPSEFECFLRRPEDTCAKPVCKHTPDCVKTIEDEITNEHCHGWICPKMQKCSAKIIGNCKTNDCSIKRTCDEMASNYSSLPLRRSLNNKEGHVSFKTNTEVSWNNNEENTTKIKMHSWLNHLKSKTELDAIELWIKNAEGQKDLKQFQDWLRSVKDVLGPGAYRLWLEEIFSSRGEEFRKWLRASHVDKLDGEKPIFLERKRPQDQAPHVLTENRYPGVPDTLNTSSPEESSTKQKEKNSLLNEKSLANVIEKLLVSNKILETFLLNKLSESNRFSLFDYISKFSPHTGEQNSSPLSPKNKNIYEQLAFAFPGNMKIAKNSVPKNHNSDGDFQNKTENSLQNRKVFKQDNINSFNVPELPGNLSFGEEKLSPPWTTLHEDFGKELLQKEGHNLEDPDGLPKDIKLMEKARYFDGIPTDAMEKLIKSLQLSSIENEHEAFNEKPIEGYGQNIFLDFPQNEKHHENRNENADHGGTFTNQTSNGSTHLSTSNDENGNLSHNFGSNISLDKSGNFQTVNDSDQLTDVYSLLKQIIDENNEETDINLFLELNKETLLPYVQSLMDTMSEENISSINMEPNSEETSMKRSFFKNNDLEDVNETSTRSISPEMAQRNITDNEKSDHLNDTYESQSLKHTKFNDSLQNTTERVSLDANDKKEQNGSRTTELIYADEELTIRSHYNPPSYGTSNAADIDDEDSEHEINERDYIDKDNQKSVIGYINHN